MQTGKVKLVFLNIFLDVLHNCLLPYQKEGSGSMIYVPAANAAGMTELRVISRDLLRRVGLEQVIRDGHSAEADCRLAVADERMQTFA